MTKYEIEDHMLVHYTHGPFFECEQCGEQFYNPTYLARHIKSTHEKKVNPNKITPRSGFPEGGELTIDFKFVGKHAVKVLPLIRDQPPVNRFICKYCERRFSNK